MIADLSQTDKRALKMGAICIAAIVLFIFTWEWLGRWKQVRKVRAAVKHEFKQVRLTRARRQAQKWAMPAFEMPQNEEKQKFLFREKVNEQLKQAGIKTKPLQVLPATNTREKSGYKMLRLKCSAEKCNFNQVLDLLAGLDKNPYLVGIEQFKIKCDEKNRQEVALDLTVSTFVKSGK